MDDIYFFYLFMEEDSVVGYYQSHVKEEIPNAVEVSREEYIAAGGHPYAWPPDIPTAVDSLKKENDLLRAQIKAATDRSDFIEDCIAEMATEVYGGV